MEGLRGKKGNNRKFHLTGELGLMVQKASSRLARIQGHLALKHAKAGRLRQEVWFYVHAPPTKLIHGSFQMPGPGS